MKYDLFISHASGDKRAFADPLAETLARDGYSVWYDRFEIEPGGSVPRSIDRGLAESAVGVAILSPNYFATEWTLRELDALIVQEIYDGKPLIPIWLNVTRDYVARFSPIMAARAAIIADKGLQYVIEKLENQIAASGKLTNDQVEEGIRRFFDADVDNQRLLRQRCLTNFSKLVSYYNSYDKLIAQTIEQIGDDFDGDQPADYEENLADSLKDIARNLEIPEHVYLNPVRTVSSEDAAGIEAQLSEWCSGAAGQYDSAVLLYDLDEWLDADYLFVLFSIPNFRVSPEQRETLNQAVIDIGAHCDGEAPVKWRKVYERVIESVGRSDGDGDL